MGSRSVVRTPAAMFVSSGYRGVDVFVGNRISSICADFGRLEMGLNPLWI